MRTRKLIIAATAVALSIGILFASGAIKAVLSANYTTHGYWYLAPPAHHWTSAIMGTLLRVAYLAIALSLLWAARYLHRLPALRRYKWMFTSFTLFILSWGATRTMETVTIWWPAYRLLLAVKVVCAIVSIATAISFTVNTPAIAAGVASFFERIATDRQRSNALRKSKDLLDRAGSLVGIGGWEIDLASGELAWSAETCRILGAPLEHKPILHEVLQKFPEEARSRLSAAIERASRGGPGWDMELPVARFDSRQIWVRVVGGVEFRGKRPVRLTGALQDISNRIDERQALQKANERVMLATDSGGIGIWDWDIAAGEIVCDDWMYRLHGLEPNGLQTSLEFWMEKLHPDDRAAQARALNDAVEGIRPYDTDFRIVWKDGTVHHLTATGKVTRDDAGRAIRMVGTNRDITESRQLVADLAEQHKLLRVTLQSIGEGVITEDAHRNIVWMNSVAERMTGWSNVDAIGRPVIHVFKAVNETSRQSADEHLSAFTVTPRPVMLLSRAGTECVVEGAMYPLRNAEEDLMGSVLVFRDVTEQRRLAQETQHVTTLELELTLKDRFLSHVSHELRSPLASIYCFTSIIDDELAGETTFQQKSYLKIVLKNVIQLQAMIEDLLTVTQSREGKLSFDLQSVSVTDAVAEIMSTLQGVAAGKQIALSSGDTSWLPMVYADPTRLRQLLIILLDNAVKFTPSGGAVSVHVEEHEPGTLLFQVADTGCGIAIEDRDRIFENLYQVTGQNTCDTSEVGRTGLGLGLHIARSLVSAQGGNIWVSEAPGKGSIFNFTLPVFSEAYALSAPEARLLSRQTDLPQPKEAALLPAA